MILVYQVYKQDIWNRISKCYCLMTSYTQRAAQEVINSLRTLSALAPVYIKRMIQEGHENQSHKSTEHAVIKLKVSATAQVCNSVVIIVAMVKSTEFL